MSKPNETVYTPEQVAEQWRVARSTVMAWIRAGKLKGFKVRRFWHIREGDLDAFIREDTLARKRRP
jgi:excisionase family DNA binding protein